MSAVGRPAGVTIALATLLFGETLAPLQVAGGVLVICGVLLAKSGNLRRKDG